MNASGVRPREPVKTEELFRAHAHFVARFLTRLGVPSEDLDDAVQEVFLVVHRNGGYAPGPATPTGYLASIALRAASSHRRRGRKRRDRRSEVAPDEVSSAAPDPARSLEVQQALAELQGALDGLDPQLRATLVLAELEGESCDSIATTMQVAVGTVYWRLHRARKTFRQTIESRRMAERRADGAAAALLFGGPVDALLETARQHSGVSFDVGSALARLREALHAGASIPPWATQVGIAGTVGMKAPAILSAVVLVHAIGTGVSRWHAGRAAASQPASGAIVASIAPESPHEVVPGLAAEIAPPAAAELSSVAPARAEPAVADSTHPADGTPQLHSAPVPATQPSGLAARRSLDAVIGASGPHSRIDPSAHADAPPALDPAAGTRFAADPSSPGDPPSPDAMREMQEVAAAQRLVAIDPARALFLVRAGEARFPSGYLREERRYVGVVALFKLGRLDEARADAARFLIDYPDGPFSARVSAMR
jgi:RNA polymerase sigma-70 factor (ECF subfamily)